LQRSPIIRLVCLVATCFCVAGCLSALLARFPSARADNPPLGDAVGAIEGDSISVQGPMSVDSANGQIKTILRSGSEVRVKSGQAHIDLVEGGTITICGPSHFSVLKSGTALTIALDSGTIHARIEGQLALNVYTAQILARTLPIGNGPAEVLIGLDGSGTMCLHPSKGAIRIEQQLTGQSLLIPQNGEMSIANGQLDTLHMSAGQCNCELQLSEKASGISTQVSGLGSPEDTKPKAAEQRPAPPPQTAAAPPAKEEPVYQVFMPPLHYDANAKVQQDYDPNLIVLVRRARVRPTLIFQGKVEGDPVLAQAAAPALTSALSPANAPKKTADGATWNRVRTFFHKLWSPSS
jgi:hypothetical protein